MKKLFERLIRLQSQSQFLGPAGREKSRFRTTRPTTDTMYVTRGWVPQPVPR
jgi:hypothetical protein